MKRNKGYWLSLLLTVTTLPVLGSCAELAFDSPTNNNSESPAESPEEDSELFSENSNENSNDNSEERPLNPTAEDRNFITDVVEDTSPAVVRVDVERVVETEMPEIFNNPFFERFFGDAIPENLPERRQEGLGSGFIIDSDGTILTNAHVVDNADTVMIELRDGRSYEGEVLGEDPLTDMAVIQIDADDLPTIPLGDSDAVRPGEWAIAIGNPLGLEETVTVGVISGTGRPGSAIGVPDKRVQFIQTDAAINPGNSGGPLLNARGEVIAINTAMIGQAQGLGFAVPINTARDVAQQIVETGRVEYPYVGVRMASLTPEIKRRLEEQFARQGIEIESDSGVVIVEVVEGSPAARSRLQPGDIIKELNGQTVTESEEVQRLVEQQNIGDEVTLLIERAGDTEEITVELEALPVEDQR
ncbi:PDZ domain-containing protein [Euhalothece natronophila Z-M001]|uniref:PDZ domain-containing protein n=1 Tax=Euhalothece natronophila Z-M001 TaxID=522448 RepID=A0A5B8NJV1_9CHRO|nr:HhoA/HhoB/HtrA family serine endopeptidase [Euhalothece natronophila]QDZ38630.1 PDZ domain-containing protein [Euhalothece natronophila Z-M001]